MMCVVIVLLSRLVSFLNALLFSHRPFLPFSLRNIHLIPSLHLYSHHHFHFSNLQSVTSLLLTTPPYLLSPIPVTSLPCPVIPSQPCSFSSFPNLQAGNLLLSADAGVKLADFGVTGTYVRYTLDASTRYSHL
jgi:hypothetical protein